MLLTTVLFVPVGCRSTADAALDVPDASNGIEVQDFPAPLRLRRGFDLRATRGAWRSGDEVLYGLRLSRVGHEVRNWLLALRVLEPKALDEFGEPLPETHWSLRINGERQEFRSALCRVAATVYDQHGEQLGYTEPLLPRDFLDEGVAGACRAMVRFVERQRSPVPPPTVFREVDPALLERSTVCAVALLQVVQEDSVLAPLLWEVIEKPSLWSVLGNLGARVVLRPSYHGVTETVCPVPGRYESTWRLPMSLQVNEVPALEMDLLVTESTPPYALGGGLLGASARHPREPGLEFSILLLSAVTGSD